RVGGAGYSFKVHEPAGGKYRVADVERSQRPLVLLCLVLGILRVLGHGRHGGVRANGAGCITGRTPAGRGSFVGCYPHRAWWWFVASRRHRVGFCAFSLQRFDFLLLYGHLLLRLQESLA